MIFNLLSISFFVKLIRKGITVIRERVGERHETLTRGVLKLVR
jgi:uncharacterized sodium:solute symporter family permease YidK